MVLPCNHSAIWLPKVSFLFLLMLHSDYLFQEIVQKLKIRKPMIPTRQDLDASGPSSTDNDPDADAWLPFSWESGSFCGTTYSQNFLANVLQKEFHSCSHRSFCSYPFIILRPKFKLSLAKDGVLAGSHS